LQPTGGGGDNYVSWRFDSSSPTYAGGNYEWSWSSDSGWTSVTGSDFMFETYRVEYTPISGIHTYTEGTIVSITATPNSGKYFWYWIVNNTRLGMSYTRYCPLETFNFVVDHDYNVTAYFGSVAYTIKGTYPLTIIGDITLGGKVDMEDIGQVCMLFCKYSSQPDWETSLAKAIDYLLAPDGQIDMADICIACLQFGKAAP